MVELLSDVLARGTGLRAVDAGATLSAVNRAGAQRGPVPPEVALRIARGLGARLLVSGATIGNAQRVTLTATLVDVRGDKPRASPVRVAGPIDSLLYLIEELGARVLARHAREPEERVRALGTTSLDAVRAYLQARASYRRAAWEGAASGFETALRYDSTFALAGLGLANAMGWIGVGDPARTARGIRVAWEGRERLGPADRALVTAVAGPRYPAPPWIDELLHARQEAVRVAPDNAEAWYHLGDMYYHWHATLGLPEWQHLASEAFRRAFELDSLSGSGIEASSLVHRLEMAALARDTAAARQLGALTIRATADSTYARWLLAHVSGDRAQVARVRPLLERGPSSALANLVAGIIHFGIGLDDTDAFIQGIRTGGDSALADWVLYWVAANRGRPSHAEAVRGPFPVPAILDALYWDGDAAMAERRAAELEAAVAGATPEAAQARQRYFRRACVLEQWRLARGDPSRAAAAIARLRAATARKDSAHVVIESEICAAMLEAQAAVARGEAGATALVARLDSLMRRGPPGILGPLLAPVNLVLARLFESRGDVAMALAAARRSPPLEYVPLYFSSYLQAEGRLAALAGDTAGAVQAYRRVLALWTDPEPRLVARRDSVRTELAKLDSNRR